MESVLETDRCERRPSSLQCIRQPAQPKRKNDVFKCREARQKMEGLEHEANRLEPQISPTVIR